jgi:gamma-tubulin complex component 2
VPEKAGQGSTRPSTAQETRPSSRPSTSTTRRPASAAGSSGFKVPQPPAASSSRLPQGREERQARHGKAPARVIDLEPPVQEVAALELEEVDGDESEGRRLDGVPLEVQEAWICEDLIFVLQVHFSYSRLEI